jgi:hypothetical protein
MHEPPPLGLVRHQQYPGRKRRNIFAPELCTKNALQYQRPNFGAEFLSSMAQGGRPDSMSLQTIEDRASFGQVRFVRLSLRRAAKCFCQADSPGKLSYYHGCNFSDRSNCELEGFGMTEFVNCPTCEKKTGETAYSCDKCKKVFCSKCGDSHCPNCGTKIEWGGLLSYSNVTKVGHVKSG